MSFILFNVRVYGIWQIDDKILLLKEPLGDSIVTKFPGGGLEFGEGTLECLYREFKEELNISIQHAEHFYTTDFFIPSALNPQQQVISIYYTVKAVDTHMHLSDERIIASWMPLHEINDTILTLPADRQVLTLLQA